MQMRGLRSRTASPAPKPRTTSPTPKSRRAASPASKPRAVRRASKPAQEDEDYWLNSDGQHGTPFYCSGRPRPLLRGRLHLYAALSAPLWTAYQLSLCHSGEEIFAVLIACFGAASMLSASGCYHCIDWKTEAREEVAGKADLACIYLQIAFGAVPIYVLLLPPPLGWWSVLALAACATAGVSLSFSRMPVGRHAGTIIYILMAALQAPLLLAPLAPDRGTHASVLSRMRWDERSLLLAMALSYLGGSQVYAHARPKLWPSVFGFHELWHVCVAVGTGLMFACNCCLLARRAGTD